MRVLLLFGALLLCFLQGCASTTNNLAKQQSDNKNPQLKPPINVTPLTTFFNASTGDGADFRNCYTRLVITSSMDRYGKAGESNDDMTFLNYKERSALQRYFWGSKFDLNLSAKIKIGEYETTIPLITLSHQSNTDGEIWSRTISHKKLNFPLFLVKEDGETSIPDIRLQLSGSKDYASNMAGTALQVAVNAIQQVAPETAVLTKLSAQSTKDTARAIDNAIGKLFSSGITEEHISDCDFRKWDSRGGLEVLLAVPKDEDKWANNLHNVGKWTISFDDPRPSIFSNWRICKADDKPLCRGSRKDALKEVHLGLDPAQVLNYTLIKSGNGLGTIKAYLLQQGWYVAAQTAFNGDAGGDKKTADDFCRNVENEITGLGLNGDDAKVVVWAVINGLPQPSRIHQDAFKSAAKCAEALDEIDLDRRNTISAVSKN